MIKNPKNKKIVDVLEEIAYLIEVKSSKEGFRVRAYRKAASVVSSLEDSLIKIYQSDGIKGVSSINGIGKSISEKIEELIKKGEIQYLRELRDDTAIRQIVTHYFEGKGVDLTELKKSARKRDIVYARYTKPAKQLIELSGNVKKAKEAIDIVSKWAISRNLDYTIETVSKKWPELKRLKPKKVEKKPFYKGNPLVWSDRKKKWFVIDQSNTWLEFADTEDKIEWKIVK
jgi:DNA polymerase/3'-5' exonuclease PolX